LRIAVVERFSDKVVTVLVYGSKARGDYHDESDIDVLVIVTESDWKFADKVREIGYALDEEIDYRLSIQVMSETKVAYLRENNFQFAQNIFRDAVSA
jgi:predicted nucleotidyltransferase